MNNAITDFSSDNKRLVRLVHDLNNRLSVLEQEVKQLKSENWMLYELAGDHNMAMCDRCQDRHFTYPSVNGLLVGGEGVCTNCLLSWWNDAQKDGEEFFLPAAGEIAKWYLTERPAISWIRESSIISAAIDRILSVS